MKIVSTKSTDGIEYRGLLSEAANPKGIIIHIHGMSGSIIQETYYQSMYEQYPLAGWSFLAGEHRGTGSVTQYNSDNGTINLGNTYEIFEDSIHDIQGWINFAKNLGYKRIWLQSHSLGPSKVAYYMNIINPEDVEGLVWISPSDMLGLVNTDEDREDHKFLLEEAKKLMSEGRGSQLLSRLLWGENLLSAQTYISFFGENAKDNIFNYGDPNFKWEVVNSINVPVLAITGTNDDGIIPVTNAFNAMQILQKQLKNSPRNKTIVLENAEHSFEGFEKNIIKDVLDFVDSK